MPFCKLAFLEDSLVNYNSICVCLSSSSSTYCCNTPIIFVFWLPVPAKLLGEEIIASVIGETAPLFSKMISDFNLLIYDFKESKFPVESSFIETLLTLIILTFLAKIRVDLVSCAETQLGLILAITWVFELPPSESLSKKVNFESR